MSEQMRMVNVPDLLFNVLALEEIQNRLDDTWSSTICGCYLVSGRPISRANCTLSLKIHSATKQKDREKGNAIGVV